VKKKAASIGAIVLGVSAIAYAASGMPNKGTIVVSIGMGGVDLGTTQAAAKKLWGAPVSCRNLGADGTSCEYEQLSSGHTANVTYSKSGDAAVTIETDVTSWDTAANIHVGSTAAQLEAAYGSELNTTACGGADWPCILGTDNGQAVDTVFQLISGEVSSIKIEYR
jgi:hypothetical protein